MKGGFDTIISQSSGSYLKKSWPLSICDRTTLFVLDICLTNSLSGLSKGHQTILSEGINSKIGVTPYSGV